MKSVFSSSRPKVFNVLGVILAGSLVGQIAAQQAGALSSETGWTAAGAVAQSGAATENALVISAGGQAFRSYDAEGVTVRLVSRPYFAEGTENSPVLEIGSAGVAFVRDSKNGRLLFIADQVVPLPFQIPLSADGRSIHALDLRLRFDRTSSIAELTLDDLAHSAKAEKGNGPVEVSISAGATALWEISTFEVTTANGGSSQADAASASPSALAVLASSEARKIKKDSRANALVLFQDGRDIQAEASLLKGNRTPSGTGQWHAESAHALTMLALEFARMGDKKTAMRIVDRALAQIDQVTANAAVSDTGLLANNAELEGFVAERFLGDWTRAKNCYQRALKNNPESTAAKAESNRLERTETRIVITPPGRG